MRIRLIVFSQERLFLSSHVLFEDSLSLLVRFYPLSIKSKFSSGFTLRIFFSTLGTWLSFAFFRLQFLISHEILEIVAAAETDSGMIFLFSVQNSWRMNVPSLSV